MPHSTCTAGRTLQIGSLADARFPCVCRRKGIPQASHNGQIRAAESNGWAIPGGACAAPRDSRSSGHRFSLLRPVNAAWRVDTQDRRSSIPHRSRDVKCVSCYSRRAKGSEKKSWGCHARRSHSRRLSLLCDILIRSCPPRTASARAANTHSRCDSRRTEVIKQKISVSGSIGRTDSCV